MEVLLANPRGFCAGVERAIETVQRALELLGAPIYVRHEIVHNRYVVDDLRAKGAVFVDELDEVPPGGTVIFLTNAAHPASDTAIGHIGNAASFRPMAKGVPLSTSFSVNIPNLLSYPWTGAEGPGGYLFFILMVKAGLLPDGLGGDKLLGAALARFSFP